jgi:micrococcal nuclease
MNIPLENSLENITKTEATVVKVIDGDTIEVLLDGKNERIRLIGVDAPELEHDNRQSQHFGQESKSFVTRQLKNKKVSLFRDNLCSDRDKHNRLLRYVYADEKLFNARIIATGYAYAFCAFPFERKDQFLQLEAMARENNRGMWGNQKSDQTPGQGKFKVGPGNESGKGSEVKDDLMFVASRRSRVFHYVDCPAVQDIAPRNLVYFRTSQHARESGRRPCKICGGISQK